MESPSLEITKACSDKSCSWLYSEQGVERGGLQWGPSSLCCSERFRVRSCEVGHPVSAGLGAPAAKEGSELFSAFDLVD